MIPRSRRPWPDRESPGIVMCRRKEAALGGHPDRYRCYPSRWSSQRVIIAQTGLPFGSGQHRRRDTPQELISLLHRLFFAIIFLSDQIKIIYTERVVHMLELPVSPGSGRDGDPGRAEEDWLAWCESVENQLGPEDEDSEADVPAPWDADLDALIAECREGAAAEAAFAARAARAGACPAERRLRDGRRGPGQPGSAVRRQGEFPSRAAGFGGRDAAGCHAGVRGAGRVRGRGGWGRRPVRGCL